MKRLVLMIVATVLVGVCGCGSDGKLSADPRPRAAVLGLSDAGKSHIVASGDVVRILLPCDNSGCWILSGKGFPHLVNEAVEDDGAFRFRAAAPGQCSLRFSKRGEDALFYFTVTP